MIIRTGSALQAQLVTEKPTPSLQTPPKDLLEIASLGAPWALHPQPLLSLLEPGL